MFKKYLSATVFAASALVMASQSLGAAETSSAPMFQFGSDQYVGDTTLLRSPTGVSFSVASHGPDDGSALDRHMTTVWLVVFNEPRHCTPEGGGNNHPTCSLDDVMSAMGGGPNEPVIDVLYGTGNVVGDDSQAHFAGFKKVGDLKKSTFGIGLQNSAKAEVHLVVRSHGPVAGGYGVEQGNVAEAIGSFIGGCGGIPWFDELGTIPSIEGQCNDIFYSVHLADQ